MDEREVYARLTSLVQQAPSGLASNDTTSMWMARVHAVVSEAGQTSYAGRISAIISTKELAGNAQALRDITAVAQLVIAAIELRLPSSTQGGFIGAGNAFDGLAAVGKVLTMAKTSLRIVDPYMDEKILTDFATLAPEHTPIELLADERSMKSSLGPATKAWRQQYGNARPLAPRKSAPGLLHDRLIIVDGQDAYNVSQSFKDLAARSPATIIRMDAETATLKIAAYEAIWATATPLS